MGKGITVLDIGHVRGSVAKGPRLKRGMLLRRRDSLLRQFSDAVGRSRNRRMRQLYMGLSHVNELLGAVGNERGEPPEPAIAPLYVVSSLFLDQCFRELTADASEQFFFITGAEIGAARVLDQRIEFAHDKRSVVGVTGNMAATHQLLIRLEQSGHRLLAHFHSHPGTGLAATNPSGTDTGFQKRLESAGYPTVAAIFSRDGYIRFFRLDHDFRLQIHGTGVEDIGGHTYRLISTTANPRGSDSRR